MSTLFAFSQHLKMLNNEQKYSEALLHFKSQKSSFTPNEIGNNKFIVNEMLVALLETGNYEALFSFLVTFQTNPSIQSFPYLLKRIKDKTAVPWNFVCKFCDLVDVVQLESTCRKIEIERKGVRKEMELASAQEEWYALKTKALFETGQYEACSELSKVALGYFEKFHYSYDIWFARRIALCKKQTGKTTEALQELLSLLKKKKEWFIQSEIAGLYWELNEPDNALKFAIEAMLNFGDLEYKVGLITMIADILNHKGDVQWAYKHYVLSKLLREQENWNIPSILLQKINRYNFQAIEMNQISGLVIELTNYWKTTQPPRKKLEIRSQKYAGHIAKILHNDPNGIDGFIRDGNEQFYFRINYDLTISHRIKSGNKVEFEKKYSEKYNKVNAIHIKLCD